jgi:hypothetical protein
MSGRLLPLAVALRRSAPSWADPNTIAEIAKARGLQPHTVRRHPFGKKN